MSQQGRFRRSLSDGPRSEELEPVQKKGPDGPARDANRTLLNLRLARAARGGNCVASDSDALDEVGTRLGHSGPLVRAMEHDGEPRA